MKLHRIILTALFVSLSLSLCCGQNLAFAADSDSGSRSRLYKQVDEQGNVTYTDNPPIDNTQTVEEIQIGGHTEAGSTKSNETENTTNTLEKLKQEVAQKAAVEKAGQEALKRQYAITIDTPKAGQVFSNDTMEIMVTAKVTPPLAQGDRFQILVNNLPVLPPQTDTTFKLPFLPSGNHEIKVEVITPEGIVSSVSNPVTITQMRMQGNEVNPMPNATQSNLLNSTSQQPPPPPPPPAMTPSTPTSTPTRTY